MTPKKKLLIGLGVGALIIVITLILLFIFKPWDHSGKGKGTGGTGTGPDKPITNRTDISLGDGPSAISCWAWNSLVTGGFMGYGIFANHTNGYTWNNDGSAVGPNTKISTTWDDQGQNTVAKYAAKNGKTGRDNLANIDSGSQFLDFISNNGSYTKNHSHRALNGIKIQYDAKTTTDMSLSDRGKQLVKNLVKDGIHVGLLIGGKPKTNGASYHGISFHQMQIQIENASQWIIDSGLGDSVYVALDIEPADTILGAVRHNS